MSNIYLTFPRFEFEGLYIFIYICLGKIVVFSPKMKVFDTNCAKKNRFNSKGGKS